MDIMQKLKIKLVLNVTYLASNNLLNCLNKIYIIYIIHLILKNIFIKSTCSGPNNIDCLSCTSSNYL